MKKTLWAFDFETDPFLYGRIPKVFAACAVSENGDRVLYWGDDAIDKFMVWALELKDAILIGHNAGKFDTLFMRDIIGGSMLVVDGRIIKCKISKTVEVRDSFAILPMPLKNLGAKYEIDYKKLERENREKHRTEITRYLVQDCEVLLSAVQNFYTRAGKQRLTIAGQASAELREIYPDLPKIGAQHDAEFRQFFYGGRVQALEKGILLGDFKMYDVNSMYPAVMATEKHPYGSAYKKIPFSIKNMPVDGCGFFFGICDSHGALPVRMKDKTTPYSFGRVEVAVTLHEIKAGIECGLIKNISGTMLLPEFKTDFSKFILPHYESRLKAKAIGDAGGDIYHKLIPNSSYGRFAMSPDGRDEIYYAWPDENIKEMVSPIERPHFAPIPPEWKISDVDMIANRFILKRPAKRPWTFFEDVATGASITGAARARLLRALAGSVRPIYCDTDSILCEELNEEINPKKLGAWKHEGDFDCAAIAGKKMYTLLKNKRPIKSASKGVKACPTEIYMAADGETVKIYNNAPTMRLGGVSFVSRDIRRT